MIVDHLSTSWDNLQFTQSRFRCSGVQFLVAFFVILLPHLNYLASKIPTLPHPPSNTSPFHCCTDRERLHSTNHKSPLLFCFVNLLSLWTAWHTGTAKSTGPTFCVVQVLHFHCRHHTNSFQDELRYTISFGHDQVFFPVIEEDDTDIATVCNQWEVTRVDESNSTSSWLATKNNHNLQSASITPAPTSMCFFQARPERGAILPSVKAMKHMIKVQVKKKKQQARGVSCTFVVQHNERVC